MDYAALEAPLVARTLAGALNEGNVRPEIRKKMPTP